MLLVTDTMRNPNKPPHSRDSQAWVYSLCCSCSCSVVSDSLWPHALQHIRLPFHYVLEFVQIHVCWVGDAIQLFHPLSPPSPVLNLSQHQGLFQWVSSLHKVAKVLELHHQQQSFQWTFRLISFRIDWFDLLAVQEALKSFRQHYSFKQSILQCSAFFMVQLSHPYMTTG